MTETFIHLGLHKTATTLLQNKIFPLFDNVNLLTRPYTQLNHNFNKLQYANDSHYCEHEFLSEINKFLGKKILISDEMLSGQPFFNYINQSVIAERLKQIFPDATIIIFLRGQQDILYSLYSSWLKALGGQRRFESFLWFPEKDYTYENYLHEPNKFDASLSYHYYYMHDAFSLHLNNFLYYELISFYKENFSNVHVFLYEEFSANPKKVLHSLEEIVGEKIVGLDSWNFKERLNTRLSQDLMKEFRISNISKNLTKNPVVLKFVRSLLRGGQKLSPNFFLDSFEVDSDNDWINLDGFYRENNERLMTLCPHLHLEDYPDAYEL